MPKTKMSIARPLALKFILVFLLFQFFPNVSFCQDSLLTQLQQTEGIYRIPLLKEISWKYRRSNQEKAVAYAREGMHWAIQEGDSIQYYQCKSNLGFVCILKNDFDVGIVHLNSVLDYTRRSQNLLLEEETLGRLGAAYSQHGSYHIADSLNQMALSICQDRGDKERILIALLSKGYNYLQWKKYDAAEDNFLEALDLSRKIGDIIKTAKLYNNLGIVYEKQSNYPKALEYYHLASQSESMDELFYAKTFNNIGIIFGLIEEWEKALDYHEKSLTLKRKLGYKKSIARSLNNMGTAHKNLLNYGKALQCYDEALNIKTQLKGTNTGMGMTLNNLGNVYLELQKYGKAESYHLQSLKLSEETLDSFGICRAQYNLAETYRRKGEYSKSADIGTKNMMLAKKISNDAMIQKSAKLISEAYSKLNNYKKAYYYQDIYWKKRDSILSAENMQTIAKLELKYNHTQKENQLELQNKTIENLTQKTNIARLKNSILILSCVFMLIVIGLLFYQKKKRKRQFVSDNSILKESIRDLSEKNLSLEEKLQSSRNQMDDYLKPLLSNSNKLLTSANKEISPEIPGNETRENINLYQTLSDKLKTKEDWSDFMQYFTHIHKDFFKNLNKTHPQLSTYDFNLCALLKLNLNNKEIAQILGISPPSVKKAKQRLYQKMKFKDNQELKDYIIQL